MGLWARCWPRADHVLTVCRPHADRALQRAAHPVGFVDEATGAKLEVCADVILDGSALSPPHDYTFDPAAIRLGQHNTP